LPVFAGHGRIVLERKASPVSFTEAQRRILWTFGTREENREG